MCTVNVVTVHLLISPAVQILVPKRLVLQHDRLDTFWQIQKTENRGVVSPKVTHLKELVIVLLHFNIADSAYKMSTMARSRQRQMYTDGKNGLCITFSFNQTNLTFET